jgi:hypothetical protein
MAFLVDIVRSLTHVEATISITDAQKFISEINKTQLITASLSPG